MLPSVNFHVSVSFVFLVAVLLVYRVSFHQSACRPFLHGLSSLPLATFAVRPIAYYARIIRSSVESKKRLFSCKVKRSRPYG